MNTKSCSCTCGIVQSSNPFVEGGLATSQRVAVGAYRHVRIAVDGVPVWIKFGDSTVTATAGTAGELLLPAQSQNCFDTSPVQTNMAIIEARTSAMASVDVMG